jgi:hypothetical protein
VTFSCSANSALMLALLAVGVWDSCTLSLIDDTAIYKDPFEIRTSRLLHTKCLPVLGYLLFSYPRRLVILRYIWRV